jgi:glycerate kinase
LVLGVTVGSGLGWEKTLVVAGVRCAGKLLRINGFVHVGDLLVTGEGCNVARSLAGAVGAVVRGVKTTGGTIEPVLIVFDRVRRVVA